MDETMIIFRDTFNGIVEFMKSCELRVFGVDFTLWTLFLWSLIGGVVVFFFCKFFDS